MDRMTPQKILIGVSSCLMGEPVRYDGKHQFQPLIAEIFSDEFKLVTFCPEVDIGLGVPRPRIILKEMENGPQGSPLLIQCVDEATSSIDYTKQLKNCCNQTWVSKLSGYLFKTKSPSCGVSKAKVYGRGQVKPVGQGIFAEQLIFQFPELPVIEEDQLNDSKQVSLFIEKVRFFHQNYR